MPVAAGRPVRWCGGVRWPLWTSLAGCDDCDLCVQCGPWRSQPSVQGNGRAHIVCTRCTRVTAPMHGESRGDESEKNQKNIIHFAIFTSRALRSRDSHLLRISLSHSAHLTNARSSDLHIRAKHACSTSADGTRNSTSQKAKCETLGVPSASLGALEPRLAAPRTSVRHP